MKYILVLLVILIAVGVWRKRHRAEPPRTARAAPANDREPPAPQDMVACAHCGLHLPRGDALALGAPSQTTYYCSAEHRAQGPA